MAARVRVLAWIRPPNDPMSAAAMRPTHFGVEAAAGVIAAGIILIRVAGRARAALHARRWKTYQRKREGPKRQTSDESPHRLSIVGGGGGRVNISMASALTDA